MEFQNNSVGSHGTALQMVSSIVVVVFAPYQQQCFIPAYQLAVEEANAQYQDIRLHFELVSITRPHITSCVTLTADVVDLAALFYYRTAGPRKRLIIISPSCVPMILEIAPVLNEWNVPFITISGNSPVLRNKKKYPTTISTSVTDNSALNTFLGKILDRFHWSNVFLLCDTNDRATPFYGVICSGVRSFLRRNERYVVDEASFDSASAETASSQIFEMISRRARVVFIFADSAVTRQILIQAHQRKMTEGDYVYFFTQPYVFEPFFSALTWKWNTTDTLRNMVREALRSVFYIVADTDPLTNNLAPETLNGTLQQIKAFGTCRDHSTVPVEALLAYESVGLMAKVAHDIAKKNSSVDPFNLFRGTNIIRELSNRTYQASLEEIAFDKDGIRIPNYVMKQFNFTSGFFESVVFYHGKQQTLSLPYGRNLTWRGGQPPDNEPRCGFDGSNAVCRTARISPTEIALISIGTAAFLFACLLYWCVRKSIQDSRASEMVLSPTSVLVKTTQYGPSNHSKL